MNREHALTISSHSLFREASKVDVVTVSVEVEELDAGPEVVHQLAERPR